MPWKGAKTEGYVRSVPEASRCPSSMHEPEPKTEIEEAQDKCATPAASSQLARSLEVNPLWSPKTQAEFQLRQKRPSDLDEQARRIEMSQGGQGSGSERGSFHRREVRVDEKVAEPMYSPEAVPAVLVWDY